MTETILFLCPHHAAKSVIAAVYFDRMAAEQGLDFRAASAGTEPDTHVSPAVAAFLLAQGVDVSTHQPRHVTADDLSHATRVISMGCRVDDLPLKNVQLELWDDVPPVSQNLPAAVDAIQKHLDQLFAELGTA